MKYMCFISKCFLKAGNKHMHKKMPLSNARKSDHDLDPLPPPLCTKTQLTQITFYIDRQNV